jgi:hypothetical protein
MPPQHHQFQMQRPNSQFQPQGQNFQPQGPSNPAYRPNPQAPRLAVHQAPGTLPRGPCFNYGQHGHFANRCPVKKMNPVTGANQQPLQPRNSNQVQQNYAYGHVNHVAV